MSTPTAVLHPFPVVTNLLLTGKSFSEGFFGDLHRQLLFTSPKKTVTAGLYMRRVPLPSRCQAGTRLLHAGFIPAWLDHHRLPTGSKGSNILHSIAPSCKPAPRPPPRELNTPLECCESCAGQYPPLPTVSRTMRTANFQK